MFIHPSIDGHLDLLPPRGHCDHCRPDHGCANNLLVSPLSGLLCLCPEVGLLDSRVISCVIFFFYFFFSFFFFFEKPSDCFPKQLQNFTFHQQRGRKVWISPLTPWLLFLITAIPPSVKWHFNYKGRSTPTVRMFPTLVLHSGMPVDLLFSPRENLPWELSTPGK